MTETDTRWARGVAVMETIQGADRAAEIRAGLDELFPGFGRYAVEAGFGDVYAREGLDLRTRQLVTIASLATLGGCEPQLAVHVRGALTVGATSAEILEAVFQLTLYAGHPRAINALRVVREVFDEQGVTVDLPASGS